MTERIVKMTVIIEDGDEVILCDNCIDDGCRIGGAST